MVMSSRVGVEYVSDGGGKLFWFAFLIYGETGSWWRRKGVVVASAAPFIGVCRF